MTYKRGEEQYLDWAERILEDGESSDDRTRVGTIELFGEPSMQIDLRKEFPLLTSKAVPHRLIRSELAWMLRGDTNLRYLAEQNNHIWDEWPFTSYLRTNNIAVPEQGTDEWKQLLNEYLEQVMNDDEFSQEYGELGPVYGHQWRAWQGYDGSSIDQLATIEDALRTHNKKLGRRLIVSAWNVGDLEAMDKAGLPPCHTLYQFNSSTMLDSETGKPYLDLQLYQRSADWFLGVPFNMAQYSLLLAAMAQTTDHIPRYFFHKFGSAHIYKNHVNQVKEQLSRRDELLPPAQLSLNQDVANVGSFEADDFIIENYQHHAAIKGQVAI